MKEIEHGSHPSTYLPKTQVPGTENFYRLRAMPERDGVDAILDQWNRERPELDPSPIGIVGRVSRLARELEGGSSRSIASTGSRAAGTTCWPRCAARARRSGCVRPISPSATMLTSSGTTKRLDKLEQPGLIAREPDPNDRRGVLIALTGGREGGDRRHDRRAPRERAPPARRAERGRAASARRPAAQAPARTPD